MIEKVVKHLAPVVIFDMDGLIVDSELLQSISFKAVLKEHGVEVKDEIVQVLGVREIENLEMMKEKYGLKADVGQLMKEKGLFYRKLLKDQITTMPGLFPLIKTLKQANFILALASSTLLQNITTILKKFKLEKEFKVVVSGEFVKKGKPDPEIYLTTAERLGVKPENCVVLEDASTGVNAAKNAGMKCIAVPNRYTEIQDFSRADLKVKSLSEITAETIKNLIKD